MKYDIQYDLDVYSYSDFMGGTIENKCLVIKVEGFLGREKSQREETRSREGYC